MAPPDICLSVVVLLCSEKTFERQHLIRNVPTDEMDKGMDDVG